MDNPEFYGLFLGLVGQLVEYKFKWNWSLGSPYSELIYVSQLDECISLFIFFADDKVYSQDVII